MMGKKYSTNADKHENMRIYEFLKIEEENT